MFEYSYLTKLGVVKKFGAHQVFFNEGDKGTEMFIILKGRVGIFSKSIEGSFVQVAETKAGGFFGEMSLLEELPRSASATALEDTVVISLDGNNFNSVISHSPEFAFRIMKGLSSRVRRMTEELLKGNNRAVVDPKPAERVQEPQPKAEDLTEAGNYDHEKAPSSHEQYLFDKEIECPICGHRFITKMVRTSKMMMKGIQPDLRQCYEGFEPLWYLVWACPRCCYANFHYQFKQVTEEQQDKILRDQLQMEQGKLQRLKVIYSTPRTFGEVIRSYELAHENFSFRQTDLEDYAKYWLRLSWLFSDVGNTIMYEKASAKALDYYKEIYFNSRTTSAEQESRLALILGELNYRLKNYEEAVKNYHKALVRRGGNPVVNRQAEDRIAEIKKLIKGAN
jgi:hypothetical protein